MPSQKRSVGEHGELLAQMYLKEQGYTIIANNWHCQFGEIDIVAQQNTTLVFVEVKTRRGSQVQQAFAAITPSKREKLVTSAHLYIEAHSLEDIGWRIDVIGIALPRHSQPIIEHVEDALDW